ncbi:MAG: PorT family protein [Duncaniella sp.]|uniref:porin family protein n=1 Tax=Duncaniella sp. TaxID=2518496 RepID=UPI0023CA4B68|nr:porin family protein [Duncaniella sp.]MDE5988747.1 PorT family protein [Duncaniella sp.]MDE6175197.1 PorT family protein [Duncaniella sp.]
MAANRFVGKGCIALLFALVLLLPFGVSAQREYSPNFSIGGKAGATLSRVSFSPEVHQKFTQGLTMGVACRYTEEKIFGLIGEINITQRGWAEDFARDEAPEFQYERTLTYVSIPVLTHIYFGSQKFRGFINLGPEVGFMIGNSIDANFDYNNHENIPELHKKYRNNAQLSMAIDRKFDYGIAGGAGIELLVKRKHSIMLEGRYYFGLGNIFKDSKRDFFAASRNNSIEISLKYMIRVK